MEQFSLVKYGLPRILAIDFSQKEVKKLIDSGFEVRRASTGVDNGEFLIPCSISDVEIVLFKLTKGCLSEINVRKKSLNSVEDNPCFPTLLEEVWNKRGFSLLFVDNGVTPKELEVLGIENTGVIDINRKYFSASLYNELYRELKEKTPVPIFPCFRGQSIILRDNKLGEILKEFIDNRTIDFKVFAVKKCLNIFNSTNFYETQQNWIITENSSQNGALAVELNTRYREDGKYGGILLLPSFGERNVDVAIALIDRYISQKNPDLFSNGHFKWLDEYKPITVRNLESKKEKIINDALNEISQVDEEIKQEVERTNWITMLLVAKGDELTAFVTKALSFLGFRVVDMDQRNGNRKREDLRIFDDTDDFFALVEVKSSDRGANEKMIRDLQDHQARYSRENNCSIPNSLLVVNHSIRIPPQSRNDFYKATDILERLNDQLITAIDTTYLYDLCQKVLSKEIELHTAKSLIKSGPGILKEVFSLSQE